MKKEIDKYFESLKKTIDSISRDEVSQFIKILNKARLNGNTIYIMGNGGSASTASHYVCDFNKVASYGYDDKKRFKFIALNDSVTTTMSYSNDVCYEDIFVEQLKNFLEKDDVVIGLSGSGNSQNVLRAIDYANKHDAITVGLTGYNGGRLKELAQCSINTNINDMQISEDMHLVLGHLCMRIVNLI